MDEFLSPHARSVLLGDRRCTATARDGERCGRSSAVGQFVCDRHGAKAPLSLKAGRERMALLAEPALDVLFRATRSAPPCPHCERSDADRDPTAVRAAIAILDRFGLGPHASLTIEQPAPDAFANYTENELLAKLDERITKLTEHRDLILRSRTFADYKGPDGFNTARPEALEGFLVPDDEPEPETERTGSENSPQPLDSQSLPSQNPVCENAWTSGPTGEPEVDGPKPQGVLDPGEVDDAS